MRGCIYYSMTNSFQDVVSEGGRSIRRIPVSDKPRIRRHPDSSSMGVIGKNNNSSGGRRGSRFGMWIVAVVAIVILFIIISVLFSGVKIEITPRQEAVLIDGEFTAFKEAQSGELSFKVMTLRRELSDEVATTGEEFVNEKASGRIIVYNNYSSASQKLIDNTRFETTDGLIYRIKDAVFVPGRKTVGGETISGSLEVTVYADKTGDAYNINLVDFTIPGLKGDPRYSKFYARSKTAMTGGFSGTMNKASPEDLANVSAELYTKLKAEILEEVISVKPEGFILLADAYVIDIESSTTNSDDGNVLLTQRAEFQGLIFDQSDFAKFVAENTIALYDGALVKLYNTDDLRLTIKELDLSNLISVESVSFDLSGETKIVWTFDEETLLADLKGQTKKDVEAILARYPGISTASVILRPFWKRSITDNIDKIKLRTIID